MEVDRVANPVRPMLQENFAAKVFVKLRKALLCNGVRAPKIALVFD